MTTAHAATPWDVSKGFDGSIDVVATRPHRINNISAGTPIICSVFLHEDAEAFSGKANAEFIVRACNAHDDLVKALQEAEHFLKFKHASDEPHMLRIAAALAKAGAA